MVVIISGIVVSIEEEEKTSYKNYQRRLIDLTKDVKHNCSSDYISVRENLINVSVLRYAS
ncbi:MAG: hypothetical protein LBS34_01230 [Rickettsiales bacterium]|nr:hypothetical protein [Rickettsiales bacterium]